VLREFLKIPEPGRHSGELYVRFLEFLHQTLRPRSYLEIGTETGASLALARCPSLAVDPEFKIDRLALGARAQTFLFQMTSDEFFRDHDVRRFFPGGVDLCFLDGMHRLEYLLRDFTNAEKACHARSLVVLHDCLPLDGRMAERVHSGPPGSMWSGDVWKLVPILREHRPDLRVILVDAPPTGLALVTDLDPSSTALADRYYEILDAFAGLTLDEYGLRRLYESYPTLSSRKLLESPHALTSFLSLY
jgi:hypothetical protein